MKKYKIHITTLLIILTSTLTFGQSNNYSDKVSMHIELPKDTFLLGEPFFFNYVLKNNSNESIYVEEGHDIIGMSISFNIYIISSDNDTLKTRELWGTSGRIDGFHEIKPHESRKLKLFLPRWVYIEKADNYKLSFYKIFRIAPSNPYLTGDYAKVENVPKESSVSLPVIDNQAKLGDFIANMVKEIKAETHGIQADCNGVETVEGTSTLSERFSEYLKIIEELKDDRIVPFLIESYNNHEHFTDNLTINYLSKYPNSEGVLEVLIRASSGEDNSKHEIFKDSINCWWSAGYTRQVALLSIMKCKDEKAIDYLISKKNDEFPHERYVILIRARYLLDKEDRLRIYHAFEDDEHIAVAKKAKEELELMKKE